MLSILPSVRDVELHQPWNHFERHDENDIPPECRLGQVYVRDEAFDDEFESELHELFVRGSIRVRTRRECE